MTRRSIKAEKPLEEDEEVIMTSSVRAKRKSRTGPSEKDTEMAEAPSFPAMPTPGTSFGGDIIDNMAHGLRQESVAGRFTKSGNTPTTY
jgi:hypothetical protein